MQNKPVHKDIGKYGYFLQYSPSKDKWYAAYDTGKSTVWYIWDRKEFEIIDFYQLPLDLGPRT